MQRAVIIQLLFLNLFLTIGNLCNAQFQHKKFELFNVENGLPSDFIYKCWQDRLGYLWVSTDAGLSKFDGKNFHTFRAQDGLPDNEVEHFIQEKNGIIWVQTHSGKIAYFDELRRVFIKPSVRDPLGKIKNVSNISTISSGGIMIQSLNGTYTLIEKNLRSYPLLKLLDSSRVFKLNKDSSEFRYRLVEHKNHNTLTIYHTKKNKVIDKKEVETSAKIISYNPHDSSLYLFEKKSSLMSKISEFTCSPLGFKETKKVLLKPYDRHNFTNKFVNVCHRFDKNKISVIAMSVYDIQSLQLLFPIEVDAVAWHMINDQNNNLWVSTHTGLLCFKRSEKINSFLRNEYDTTMFYCIAERRNGSLIFGSQHGEIIEKEENKTIVHKVKTKEAIEWQRYLIVSQNKVFTFTDGGIIVNYTHEIQCKGSTLITSAVLPINDSTIILASKKKLYKLDTRTENIEHIVDMNIDVNCLASIDGNLLYLGTNEGIHTYNLQARRPIIIKSDNQLLDEKIGSFCISHDSIIWIGLESKGIVAFKNSKIIAHLTEGNGLKSTNITSLAKGKYHEIWAGTFSGVSKIKYEIKAGKIETRIQNISRKDGLGSTAIHQLHLFNNIIYAATDKGISFIPDSIPIPDIPIIISRIRINQKDTLLLSSFELGYNKNIISIDFSGVELNGYFDHAQFSEDEGLSWFDLGENNFRKQFKSGDHSIWLRAIDVNNHVSKKVTKLRFNIDKPFYENMWFWLGIASVLFAIGIYINNLLARRKHQKDIKELMNQQALDELEIQSLKAQMNPHFVFNCLNSIKGFIYDEDFEMADQYLDKFANLLRSTLEFSTKPSISLQAEIEYIETYLSLEQLRFANKFTYEVNIESNVNQQEIAIPSMILQPYVENAIKHGVCNLDDGLGLIRIKVYLVLDKLHIDIDDNGIGRIEAETLKATRSPSHQSKGTQVTQRRTELYHIELAIHDKKDNEGKSLGTLVHLEIPIPLN